MIRADRIATGLARPTFATSAPGDPDRLYITEKETGRVVLFDPASGARSVFFDIPAAEMTTSGSRGLLGLAFHPEFEQNGRLYLSLTNEPGNSEIAELSGGAMRTILEIPRTSPIHVAGWIGFGPDGLLYVPTGDSGGAAPEMFTVGLRNPWRARRSKTCRRVPRGRNELRLARDRHRLCAGRQSARV